MPIAITRAPTPTLVHCELTWIAREPIAFELALAQHQAYCAELERLGCRMVALPPDDRFPDSCFVEDTAVVLDEIAVLTHPGAESRRGEVDLIGPVLAGFRPLARVEPPATLDGGDVVRLGRVLYVGLSRRTNRAGCDALAAIGAPLGYEVVPVPFDGCLHLKSACTPVDAETVLLNAAWVDPARFSSYRVLRVAEGEPWAGDVLPVGGAVLMNAACPRTMARVASHGHRVRPMEISEFAKAEGGLTCLSLIVEAP